MKDKNDYVLIHTKTTDDGSKVVFPMLKSELSKVPEYKEQAIAFVNVLSQNRQDEKGYGYNFDYIEDNPEAVAKLMSGFKHTQYEIIPLTTDQRFESEGAERHYGITIKKVKDLDLTHLVRMARGGYYLGERFVYDNENERIDDMITSWYNDGIAYSHLKNNDSDFFERIGIPYEKVGITSQTGNDIVYYNTGVYDNDTDALRGRKMENGGSMSDGYHTIVKGKMKTKEGDITGKVVYNDYFKKYQVVIDGVVYEEFNNSDDAIDNLKGAGFNKLHRINKNPETSDSFGKGGIIENIGSFLNKKIALNDLFN